MPVNATRFVRKMRGGAQAHLLAAGTDEEHYYVTKFVDNPQHRRILINEWLAARILQYLRISCPRTAIVELSPEFLERNPEISLQLGSKTIPVSPGWHFGSEFPGTPDRDAVYDFLPDNLLLQVVNLDEFRGMLVFDKWAGNADARQSIFFRRRIRDWLDRPEIAAQQKGFIVQMVDHGYCFDGPNWDFSDAPALGLYMRHQVYESVRCFDDLQPWFDQVRCFPENVIEQAWRQIPSSWLAEDDAALEELLSRLLARRTKLERLIEATVDARPNAFPSWRRT